MAETFRSVLKILKHFSIIAILLLIIILGFFYAYLPIVTNHGDSISVPDLEGMNIKELNDFLKSKNLRFEVEEDSGYSAKYPPLAVLKQFPLPNSKVKEGRKVYVTLNQKEPPVIRVPDLYGLSRRNVVLQLNSLGLAVGKIVYVPKEYINTVLEWSYKGKKLEPNDEVPKGSKIDFKLADGAGNQKFPIPNLIGQDFEDAKVALFGMGLETGNVFFEKEGFIEEEIEDDLGNKEIKRIEVEPGKVFKQKPSNTKHTIRIGESIDLWIVEMDTVDLFNISDIELNEKEND